MLVATVCFKGQGCLQLSLKSLRQVDKAAGVQPKTRGEPRLLPRFHDSIVQLLHTFPLDHVCGLSNAWRFLGAG